MNQEKNIQMIIKKNCDNSHKHCKEIIENVKKFNKITQEYFDEFLLMINKNNYKNSCFTNINTVNFITTCSEYLNITLWDSIIRSLSDDQILKIIENQKKINNNLIKHLLELKISTAYSQQYFINILLQEPIKIKCFENILMSLNIQQFGYCLDNISILFSNRWNYILSKIGTIIINYINININNIKLNNNIIDKIIKISINNLIIIEKTFKLFYPLLNKEQKKNIFYKSLEIHNQELIILILDNLDFELDNELIINNLVQKLYKYSESLSNQKISNIIDLLVEYGFKIEKKIVLKLLEYRCSINNLEKYDIEIDNEILAICAQFNYYPYKFDIKPSINILLKECSRYNNFNTIKKLKELGGVYNSECLENACRVSKNGKVIKFLISECKVKVTDKCLINFQEIYRIEALNELMESYKLINTKNELDNNENKEIIEIDCNSLMNVVPKNIDIDINNNIIEHNIKNKVKKFFDYKKKIIKYDDLYQLFLKYLISNKLIIGNYFIINIKLANLLKINQCTIMDINQVHNILTYFIEN